MGTFKTKLYTFLSMFCSNLIEEHQWLSIATVPDAHPFTPVQRLWVVWIMTLTNFAVIGLFFGKDPVNLYSRINVAILSTVLMLPPSMFFSSLFIWINAFTSPEIVPGSHKAMRNKLKLKKLSLTLHSSSSIVTRCLRVLCCCCRSTSKVVPGGGGKVIIQHIKSKKSNEAWADTITHSKTIMTRSRSTTMIGKVNTDSIASWAPSRRQISKINEKDAVASESLNAHEEHDEEHEEEHAMDVAAEALAEAVVAAEMAEEEEEERVKEKEKENQTQKIATGTPKKPKLNFFGVARLKVTEEHLERKFSMRLKKMPVLFSPNGGESESSEEEDDETENEEKISNQVNNVHSEDD